MTYKSSIPGTQSTSTASTQNPQWSANRTKLTALRGASSGAINSVFDEIHAAGLEPDLGGLIAAQDALDEYLDRYLDQADSSTAAESTSAVHPQPKNCQDVGHVKAWLRRADGSVAPLYSIDVAAFEKAVDGEVWTRQSDNQPVLMNAEELHAYYSVDTFERGGSLKGGLTGGDPPGNDDAQSEAGAP